MVERSIDGILQPKPDDTSLKKTWKYRWTLGKLAILLLVAAILVGGIVTYRHIFVTPDPIPISIQKSVNFKVYYPEAKKLPAGYTINLKSITASNNVLILGINYGHGEQVVFTEQAVPSSSDLQTFYAQHIPLRNNFTTTVGQAAISALNNQTFVSLPTNKTWIIITAPLNINQNQLKQVLTSIRRS